MKEMMKKIVTVLLVTHEQASAGCARGSRALRMALLLALALGLAGAAQAAATYDYIAEVLVSKYADKDPTTSDDRAKCYSTYCLTQAAAQQAMGTTDAVDCETYAAWLGKNFEANRQTTIDKSQAVSYDSKTVAQYVFAYALGTDYSELNDALAVVFFENDEGDLAYNVLTSKNGETQFDCDDEYYGSSGWKAVSPAAPEQVWFDEVTVRFDTSYTTNKSGNAVFVVTHPEQVLPVTYSTNNWGSATNAAGMVVGTQVSLLYQGPTDGPTTFIDTSTTNGLYNWKPDAGDYGQHNFGASP